MEKPALCGVSGVRSKPQCGDAVDQNLPCSLKEPKPIVIKSNIAVATKSCQRDTKFKRKEVAKRPSSVGSVFRCFVGCFCTKSMNNRPESENNFSNKNQSDINEALQIIEEDLDEKNEKKVRSKPLL